MAIYAGTAGDDDFVGGTDDDVMLGGDGDDALAGGSGDDALDGGSGDDTLAGGRGNDELTGGDGDDTLAGGSGDDYIEDGLGNDHVAAGSGDDMVSRAAPADGDIDAIDGGKGYDVMDFSDPDLTLSVQLDLLAPESNSGLALGLTLSNFEEYWGTDGGNDTLLGSSEGESFSGWAGDDRLGGRGGDDLLDGGEGDDTLLGGSGDDELLGDDGNDTLSGGSGDDWIEDGWGSDHVFAGSGDDVVSRAAPADGDLDVIDGGGGHDVMDFTDEDLSLSVQLDLLAPESNGGLALGLTLSGFEEVWGTDGGSDTLLGSGRGEVFAGYAGDDTLDGRGGNDTLYGGDGSDTLTGGAGADLFVLSPLGSDTVTDFVSGIDRLQIDRYAYAIAEDVDRVEVAAGSEVAFSGSAPQFFLDIDDGSLWYDGDGAGDEADPALVATLQHAATLTQDDFVLV